MEVEYDKNGITLVEGEQHGRLLQYMQLGLPPLPLPLARSTDEENHRPLCGTPESLPSTAWSPDLWMCC